ncbi:unnamed protein product [Absidia cylindrospora]
MTHRKSSTYKYGPHFKTLSGSSRTLMTRLKSSTYKYGPHFKTLSGSSRTLMTRLKSSTYECGPHFKTLFESNLETTSPLYHLSSLSTLCPLDIEHLFNQLFVTIKNKLLASI